MTKKEIATMVAETINGLEAGMAMVGEKDGQPSVIIGKESRPLMLLMTLQTMSMHARTKMCMSLSLRLLLT